MDRNLQEVQNTVRLPVYSTDQRRPGTINPDGNPHTHEQAYINCYPEAYKSLATGEVEWAVIKRPGLATGPVMTNTIASYGTGSTMECRANIVVTALTDVNVAAFWDSTNSKIYIIQYRPTAGTTVKIGELTSCTATDVIFISEIVQNVGGTYPAGTLTPALALSYQKGDKTLGAGYYATSSGGVFPGASLTAISSGSFPSNLGTPKVITGPIQQLDGTSYIMTLEGTIYASGGTAGTLYDITLWNTNGITVASQYPDKGVAVMRYKHILVAFGQDSIEFFQDAGFPPPASPLERFDAAFIKFGVLHAKQITNIQDTIYWVAYGSNATVGIWKLEGYTPSKISIPKIDFAISTGSTTPGTKNSLECVLLNHKPHLILNYGNYYTIGYYDASFFNGADDVVIFPTTDLGATVLAYSIHDNSWWGLAVSNSVAATSFLYPATNFSGGNVGSYSQHVFSSNISGTSDGTLVFIFKGLSGDGSYSDAFTSPNPVCTALQFNTYWFGTEKRKRINKAKVIQNQIYLLGGDTNKYQMYIAYAKNDADVGSGGVLSGRQFQIPTTSNRYYISNLGMCRSIEFLLVNKTKASWRCLGLELDIDQGTS